MGCTRHTGIFGSWHQLKQRRQIKRAIKNKQTKNTKLRKKLPTFQGTTKCRKSIIRIDDRTVLIRYIGVHRGDKVRGIGVVHGKEGHSQQK